MRERERGRERRGGGGGAEVEVVAKNKNPKPRMWGDTLADYIVANISLNNISKLYICITCQCKNILNRFMCKLPINILFRADCLLQDVQIPFIIHILKLRF